MSEEQKPEAQPVARVLAVAVDGTPLRDSRGVEWLTQVALGTTLYAEADLATLRAEVEALRKALRETMDLAEFWIDRGRQPDMSDQDYMKWLALGHHSNTLRAAKQALAARQEAPK